MALKDLRQKTTRELQQELARLRDELRELRFKIHKDESKDVRAGRSGRRTIAQILTILNARRLAQAKQGKK